MYKLISRHEIWGDAVCVKRLEDNAMIPFDPDNTDYQQYLAWLEAGNTPEPADENA